MSATVYRAGTRLLPIDVSFAPSIRNWAEKPIDHAPHIDEGL